MKLIDTHCHLNDLERMPDTSQLIEEALAVGVEKMIVVGINREWSDRALELAERHHSIYAAVGHHPTSEGFVLSDLDVYAEMWKHPKVVALGEMGLDLYWKNIALEDQISCFAAQVELAVSLGAPIIVHCRDAQKELVQFAQSRSMPSAVYHCFAGDFENAKALGLNQFFGVDGPITYPKANDLRMTIAQIPVSQILLETDAPWLSPAPFRGTPNKPAYLPKVAERLAEVLNLTVEEIAEITTANAYRLFNKLV